MAAKRTVVVTQRFFDAEAIAYLEANNCTVAIREVPKGRTEGDLSPEELRAILADADGWIVGHAWITRELLTSLPRLKVISRRGVGYERVDIEAARDLGRVVAIATGGNDASVADQVIGLMLTVGRRLRESHERMRSGDWTILTGTELFRKTVGVVGLGRVGRSVVQRLSGFEARVLAHAPRPDLDFARKHGIEMVDMPRLIAESDYITLHLPLTDETRNLIDAKALAAMKPNAILINTARGGLVDEKALVAALRNGTIGGAGLDVFLAETDPAFRPVADELLSLPNVIAAPHAGASTLEGLARTNMIASRSVVAVLDGEDPPAACVVADGRKTAVQN